MGKTKNKKSVSRKSATTKKTKTPPKAAKSSKSKKEPKAKKAEEEKFPHFRKHLTAGHPALIIGNKSEEEYNYRKVTHSKKDGRHLNEEVIPNPNKKDKKPMYIGKRVRHDEKDKFSTWKYPWKYP